uniref:Integrase zinc-binding domain-containing protein n=1 Tax=Biomphalaria glabrata TaxID=6526 RepID=A0A2C9M696_BIOGL
MSISDTLSRASLPVKHPSSDDSQVHLTVDSLPVSDENMKIFQQATANDAFLRLLKDQILIGWPNTRNEIKSPKQIRAYYGIKEELSERDGLLLKGERILVPKALQKEMLQRLYQGHLRCDRCLSTAKEVFFWPGMSKQIIDMVSSCEGCNEHQKSQQKEPMLPHDTPQLPRETIGADFFEHSTYYFKSQISTVQ